MAKLLGDNICSQTKAKGGQMVYHEGSALK